MQDYQQNFFDYLKANLPTESTLPDFVRETLQVSRDGTYRRLGGKTALSFEEAMQLVEASNLNFSGYSQISPGRVIFEKIGTVKGESPGVYESFADFISKVSPIEAIAAASVLSPIFFFNHPDLAFFSMFYREKVIFGQPSLQNLSFAPDLPMREIFLENIRMMAKFMFCRPISFVLWVNSIDTVLNPILYSCEIQLFKDKSIPFTLLEQLHDVLHHLEKTAEIGKYVMPVGDPDADWPSFQLYFTELPLTDTIIFLKLKHSMMAMHPLIGSNLIATTNENYCQHIETMLKALMEKASNLYTGGEKQRIQFFKAMHKRVDAAAEQVKQIYS